MSHATQRAPLPFWRGMFYLLLATGLVLTVIRFTQGLGSVTNLSDRYPWGLWVGFDLLCGVGLAAGGFVITAVVYIFHIERLRPIVRPAIVTAFLGYLLVCVALLFDIGRPWNIWHPLILHNPHSVMFEVAWCVMLYSTVLALEFSGMVFEKVKWKRAAKVQKFLSVPLVIAGVILSTLHQSSLGTLYLVMPGKLHELWYTPMLPLLFFVSAVSIGLAMVIVESKLSARSLGHGLELPILRTVGRALAGVLGLYGFLRVYDLVDRGMLGEAFSFSYESSLFLVEFFLGVVLPVVLLSVRRIRMSERGLYGTSLLAVLGFITHRLNVSLTGFEQAQGGHYIPAWPEVLITLMFIALGFAAFRWIALHFPVYPETQEPTEEPVHHVPATPTTSVRAPWERTHIDLPNRFSRVD
ncbi:MAG: Ni/Fe-hydrogenase cytochrome b subunit [Planctomycetota bacterium]|nr:Ni/Fe-hydrogenase cytochrome b subunit [Planctomycetota bacterium]